MPQKANQIKELLAYGRVDEFIQMMSNPKNARLIKDFKANGNSLAHIFVKELTTYASNSPLVAAFKAKPDNLPKVMDLIFSHVDLEIRDEHGLTVLQTALEKDASFSIIQALIKKGADVFSCSLDGSSVLHNAATTKDKRALKCLLDVMKMKIAVAVHQKNDHVPQFNIDARNDNRITALHCACNKGDIERINLLIKEGANVSIKNVDGDTPFHYAAQSDSNNNEIIKALLNAGATYTENNTHRTPLDLAVYAGNMEIAKELILPDIHYYSRKLGTALHRVSVECLKAVYALRVEHNNFQKRQSELANELALAHPNHKERLQVKIKDELMTAHKNLKELNESVVRFNEILKLILKELLVDLHKNIENYTDYNFRDKHGATTLHYLVSINSPDGIRFLLQTPGINLDIKNNAGKTALEMALLIAEAPYTPVKLLLEAYGNAPEQLEKLASLYQIIDKDVRPEHQANLLALLEQYKIARLVKVEVAIPAIEMQTVAVENQAEQDAKKENKKEDEKTHTEAHAESKEESKEETKEEEKKESKEEAVTAEQKKKDNIEKKKKKKKKKISKSLTLQKIDNATLKKQAEDAANANAVSVLTQIPAQENTATKFSPIFKPAHQQPKNRFNWFDLQKEATESSKPINDEIKSVEPFVQQVASIEENKEIVGVYDEQTTNKAETAETKSAKIMPVTPWHRLRSVYMPNEGEAWQSGQSNLTLKSIPWSEWVSQNPDQTPLKKNGPILDESLINPDVRDLVMRLHENRAMLLADNVSRPDPAILACGSAATQLLLSKTIPPVKISRNDTDLVLADYAMDKVLNFLAANGYFYKFKTNGKESSCNITHKIVNGIKVPIEEIDLSFMLTKDLVSNLYGREYTGKAMVVVLTHNLIISQPEWLDDLCTGRVRTVADAKTYYDGRFIGKLRAIPLIHELKPLCSSSSEQIYPATKKALMAAAEKANPNDHSLRASKVHENIVRDFNKVGVINCYEYFQQLNILRQIERPLQSVQAVKLPTGFASKSRDKAKAEAKENKLEKSEQNTASMKNISATLFNSHIQNDENMILELYDSWMGTKSADEWFIANRAKLQKLIDATELAKNSGGSPPSYYKFYLNFMASLVMTVPKMHEILIKSAKHKPQITFG